MVQSLEEKLEFYKSQAKPSLVENLGIEMLELSPELVTASMPVDQRTCQPFGILHGGASVALAETIASVGGWLNIDHQTNAIAGLEINANHLRSVNKGKVLGKGKPIHIGKSTQVWSVEIFDEERKKISISRCTLAVIKGQLRN